VSEAIFDPAEHEPIAGGGWDETLARAFVERTVREADAAHDGERHWPLHPEDAYGGNTEPFRGVYCGTAGTMWALFRLAQTYGIALRNDYASAIVEVEKQYRKRPLETGRVVPSYFLGTAGIMFARYVITGKRSILDQLTWDVAVNATNPAREALWGASGTVIPLLLLRERDGAVYNDHIVRRVQKELWKTWEPDTLLWEQKLYGVRARYVGAAHGAIGNLAPLVRAPDLLSPDRSETLAERVPALLAAYVLRDGDAANWYTAADPNIGNRLQWCHGAPGVIMGLARYPSHDERVEELLVAGGEAIWCAGPLRKGPTLCHGTAGNGFALLRLAQRTGDAGWRARAAQFAMHAIRQVAAWRESFGMPAWSLWTGELGVAVFVDAVLRNDPAVLTLDAL
jgi:hypothetical protein